MQLSNDCGHERQQESTENGNLLTEELSESGPNISAADTEPKDSDDESTVSYLRTSADALAQMSKKDRYSTLARINVQSAIKRENYFKPGERIPIKRKRFKKLVAKEIRYLRIRDNLLGEVSSRVDTYLRPLPHREKGDQK